jgi:hypothetical protein
LPPPNYQDAEETFVFRSMLFTLILLFAGVPAVAGERTSLSLRAYLEYDDNVGLNTDDGVLAEPIASPAAGAMAQLAHEFTRSRNLELRGSLTAFHTQQLDDAAEDFDASGVAARFALTNRWRLGAKPATLTTTAGARGDWLGGEEYSRVVDVGSTLLVDVTRAWSLGPSISVSRRDYEDDGFVPSLSSRDALRYGFSLASEWRLASVAGAHAPARLRLSLGAQRNAADGSNYEYAALIGSAELTLPLRASRSRRAFGDLALLFSVSGMDADYDDFQPPVDRIDRRLFATLGLATELKSVGRLDLSYSWLAIESNLGPFEARRQLVRLGYTHSF